MESAHPILIVNTDRIDGEAVVVEFSDGTSITLTVEELVAVRPDRQKPTEDTTSEGDGLARTED